VVMDSRPNRREPFDSRRGGGQVGSARTDDPWFGASEENCISGAMAEPGSRNLRISIHVPLFIA
jgi:hypothetical protein